MQTTIWSYLSLGSSLNMNKFCKAEVNRNKCSPEKENHNGQTSFFSLHGKNEKRNLDRSPKNIAILISIKKTAFEKKTQNYILAWIRYFCMECMQHSPVDRLWSAPNYFQIK